MAKAQGSANARPVVVFNSDGIHDKDETTRLKRMVPAWILSFVFHILLFFLFWCVGISNADTPPGTDDAVFETEVSDNTKEPNLENEDIGLDPDVQTNYNVPRIEEISVPGPADANAPIGIHNAPEGPPMTLPPPPGVSGTGSGGGLDSNAFGTGNMQGMAGGFLGGKYTPGGFAGRSGATREQMLREGGGNAESEAAVARGIKWISQHQAPDGHWSFKDFHLHGKCGCTGQSTHDDIAATAFGLLPLLGAGQTHKSGAVSEKQNAYSKVVDKGLRYLVLKQNRDGEFHPLMYSQGLASIAICEAYALTSDPALRGPAQRAVTYIVEAQSGEGGWRYGKKQPGYDTSVCGWQLMALKSGQMAGLDVPTRTLKACDKWLNDAATPDGGSYGYTSSGNGLATSAVGLLSRQYLGWGPRNPGLIAGVQRMSQTGPQPGNMYYSYYATQVMHHMGGPAWDAWNPRMRDGLIAAQDKGDKVPHQLGSWTGGHAGRIMETSMSLLTLEVYYRHLPIYRRDVQGDKGMAEK